MSFAPNSHYRPATTGDVGVSVYVVKNALAKLTEALERVAQAAGVDVTMDVASLQSDVRLLEQEFDTLAERSSE